MNTPPVITEITRSPDGTTFTLVYDTNKQHDDKQHRYSNDQEGKRQAILDGLNSIETITVAEDVYLPSNAALQLIAIILYPDGIQTEKAYEAVRRTAAKACLHIGYGDEVELAPPAVPFPQRGVYRKRYPTVSPNLVLTALEDVSPDQQSPKKMIMAETVWNQAAWEIYQNSWSNLTQSQQKSLQQQVDAIAQEVNWQQKLLGSTQYYMQPLVANIEKAGEAITAVLTEEKGMPIERSLLLLRIQIAAYGHRFYDEELTPELEEQLRQLLSEAGYAAQAVDGEYRPLPLKLPDNAKEKIRPFLTTLPQQQTQVGTALLFQDVLQLLQETLNLPTPSQWQAEQLLTTELLGELLRQMGYKAEGHWLQPYQFIPSSEDVEAKLVILKEIRVQNDPSKKMTAARGLPVHTPALVLDGDNDNIIYLQMLGNKQAVRANWAALVAKKACWIGGNRVYLNGMKEHILLKASLPCGWVDHILIHKQASIRE
ncbi:MAG: hypothetical protein GY805_25155, partial [Chloroflexi bacterium]|nr:hypothetical protein [Chloroflexota bacterium]